MLWSKTSVKDVARQTTDAKRRRQECTRPSSRRRTNHRRKRRRPSVKSALVPSKIEGGRTWVRVGRGYLRSSQKSKDGTRQTGADRGCIHRRAVRHPSRQTPHYLPRTINAPASVGAHNTPGSLPPKHSAAEMRATPLALPPSEPLCHRWASKAPDSLLLKHSALDVRAMPPALSLRNSPPPTCAQRPQLLFALSTLLPMWARVRAGGGQ